MSDQIYIYITGNVTSGGVLTCESRYSRQSKAVSASFDDDDLFELEIAHGIDTMINRCRATVKPRSDGSVNQVLYALGEPRYIAAKDNIVIDGPYTDPDLSGKRVGAQDLEALVSGSDYLMLRRNGSGADITTSLQVEDQSGANEARFLVHNADEGDGWIMVLRKRGTPLLDNDPTAAVYEDADSIRRYGARPVSFEMPFQTDSAVAQNAAILTVNAKKSPLSNVRELRILGDASDALMAQVLGREIGDLIQVKEQVATGSVYVKFYIQHIALDISPAGTISAAWQLVPVNAQGGFWILGTSILGTDTVLGWTE